FDVCACTVGHVFLSYARRNSEFADRLVAALERRGFNVWLDRSDIPGGAAWDASVSEALQDAVGVIVVLSPDALESEHFARGGCPPRAPTDPYVRDYRIRLLGAGTRCEPGHTPSRTR